MGEELKLIIQCLFFCIISAWLKETFNVGITCAIILD